MEQINKKQPKSVLAHETNLGDYLGVQMGISNFQYAYGHFFLRADHIMGVIGRVEEFTKQKLFNENLPEFLKTKNNYQLDLDAVNKMKRIWFNGVYLRVTRNPKNINRVLKRERFIDEPDNDSYQEIIKLPALKSMNPRRLLGMDLFIRIGETLPNKFVFQGFDYKYVVTAGKFFIVTKEGKIPQFNSNEEMLDPRKKTSWIPYSVFQYILDVEIPYWQKYDDKVFGNLHKIYATMKESGFVDDDEENQVAPINKLSNRDDM